MGRPTRTQILFNGCFAHILSRSFEDRWLYEEARDFEKFLTLLKLGKQKYRFLIHHYCLMHTHFHLLVSIPDTRTFSLGLQWLKREYAVWFNRKYKRNGPLWRERFRSLIVEDETYLYACGRYIEENPVKAGLVERPEDWPYSSAARYTRRQENPLIDPYSFDGGIDKLPEVTDEMFENNIVESSKSRRSTLSHPTLAGWSKVGRLLMLSCYKSAAHFFPRCNPLQSNKLINNS